MSLIQTVGNPITYPCYLYTMVMCILNLICIKFIFNIVDSDPYRCTSANTVASMISACLLCTTHVAELNRSGRI